MVEQFYRFFGCITKFKYMYIENSERITEERSEFFVYLLQLQVMENVVFVLASKWKIFNRVF